MPLRSCSRQAGPARACLSRLLWQPFPPTPPTPPHHTVQGAPHSHPPGSPAPRRQCFQRRTCGGGRPRGPPPPPAARRRSSPCRQRPAVAGPTRRLKTRPAWCEHGGGGAWGGECVWECVGGEGRRRLRTRKGVRRGGAGAWGKDKGEGLRSGCSAGCRCEGGAQAPRPRRRGSAPRAQPLDTQHTALE
jgi:hypothetical protein